MAFKLIIKQDLKNLVDRAGSILPDGLWGIGTSVLDLGAPDWSEAAKEATKILADYDEDERTKSFPVIEARIVAEGRKVR